MERKVITDADIKKKAVKLVVAHIKKKMDREFEGQEYIDNWLIEVDALIAKDVFDKAEHIEMRRQFSDAIERVLDGDMRIRLRDSWYSFGKALDKKVKKK